MVGEVFPTALGMTHSRFEDFLIPVISLELFEQIVCVEKGILLPLAS